MTAIDSALFTDLYELKMVQAYHRQGMADTAVFTLSVRDLPEARNFLIACGIGSALDHLEAMRFSDADIDYLRTLEEFGEDFLDWLRDFRFTGDVHAVPDGTPVFADEPIMEVVAPIAEAQLFETIIMNQVHMATVLASKAARMAVAARGRPVIDYASRRMHGHDAALSGARAFYVGGAAATSNVLAGRRHGIPVSGTVAHSYIQAHKDEGAAMEAFIRLYPGTVMLVDTYDTLSGVAKVIDLLKSHDDLSLGGIRLDSGDLIGLSKKARRMLDEAGREDIKIFASGGLDEYGIAAILDAGAPIDGFGVGTRLGVAADAPSLDIVYKLTEYAGRGRVKLSAGKPVLPARKQIFRRTDQGRAAADIIGLWDEDGAGEPLLKPVMKAGGRIKDAPAMDGESSRARARAAIDSLPESVRAIAPAEPPFPVDLSEKLAQQQRALEAERYESQVQGNRQSKNEHSS